MSAGKLLVAAEISFYSLTFTGISNLIKLLNLRSYIQHIHLCMFNESGYFTCYRRVLVDVAVQGIVLNTAVHTNLRIQPQTSS